MRISALCLEFPVSFSVSRKTALCVLSDSRPGSALCLWRISSVTVLTVEAVPKIVLPEGENRVRIARDGDNNRSHGRLLSIFGA